MGGFVIGYWLFSLKNKTDTNTNTKTMRTRRKIKPFGSCSSLKFELKLMMLPL